MTHYDPGPTLPILVFFASLLGFLLPGFWWASWLHRRDGYSWPFRWVLGFAWSFAVFAPVGWPFLWLGGSFAGFAKVLAGVWLLFTGISAYFYFVKKGASGAPASGSSDSLPAPAIDTLPSPPISWLALRLVIAYVLAAVAFVVLAHRHGYVVRNLLHPDPALQAAGELLPWQDLSFLLLVVLAVTLVLILYTLLIWGRPRLPALTAWTDEEGPSAPVTGGYVLISLVAVLFIGLQTASAMFFDRPDWDDCYYLAAVLDYEHAEQFNDQEPTHREGFPVPAHNRLLVWELWGAVLCRLSGLNPMAVFHTLLPALLVPLAYAAYWQVLAEFLPRRWVPLAVLGVAAYHLWGVSSHDSPANFLLNRTTQGKAVMLHIGLPLLVVTQVRLLRQPQLARWLALLAAMLLSLAASTSTVFLGPMLLSCMVLAVIGTVPWKAWLAGGVGSALAVAPCVIYGLLIREAALADKIIAADYQVDSSLWLSDVVGRHIGYGSAEGVWFLLLPLLALLLVNHWRMTYLVIFSVILLLTYSNPFFYPWLAKHVTTFWTYFRVLWLFPVALGLGAFLALFARLLARALARRLPLPIDLTAGAIAIAGLLLTAPWPSRYALPGMYVWGSTNVSMIQAHQTPRVPPWADNILKMPADLIPLANDLLADPEIRGVRILCEEAVSNYLTPYSREFRFVETRPLYTLAMTDQAGRLDEGEKRFLVSLLLSGHQLPQEPWEAPWSGWHPFYHSPGMLPRKPMVLTRDRLEELLDELRVKYVIIYTESPNHPRKLQELGFQPIQMSGEFTLWRRDIGQAKSGPVPRSQR